jgi:hypothetical protein
MATATVLHPPVRRIVVLGRCLASSERLALQGLLGEAFFVEEGWLEDDDIVVTPTLSESVVGLLKTRHPGCLIVTVLRDGGDSSQVVEALNNGADGCLLRPSMSELAARVKSLVRRGAAPSIAPPYAPPLIPTPGRLPATAQLK